MIKDIKAISRSIIGDAKTQLKVTNVDLCETENETIENIKTLKKMRDAYMAAAESVDIRIVNILRAISDTDPVIKD